MESAAVGDALSAWVAQLDSADPGYEHCSDEALGTLPGTSASIPNCRKTARRRGSCSARAFAVRIAGRWADRLGDPLALEKAVADPHPRVRLEAVVALSYVADPQAVAVALRALDQPADRFTIAALTQASHALKPIWWPALTSGALRFADPRHLAFALEKTSGKEAAATLRELLADPAIDPGVETTLLGILASVGNADDLAAVLARSAENPDAMEALAEAAALRDLVPAGEFGKPLAAILASGGDRERAAALRLAAWWRAESLADRAAALATDRGEASAVRAAAAAALGHLRGKAAVYAALEPLCADPDALVRSAALAYALCAIDLLRAAELAGEALRSAPDEAAAAFCSTPLLGRQGGLDALAASSARRPSIPLPPPASARSSARRLHSAALEKALGGMAVRGRYRDSGIQRGAGPVADQ
ncbi:MAG: HEAT repeat domain-containing protein [Verrucomicrobiales bacterium]